MLPGAAKTIALIFTLARRQSQQLWALNLAWQVLCLLSRSASPLSQCTMQPESDITLVSMATSPDPEQCCNMLSRMVWHLQLRIRPSPCDKH